MMFRAVVLLATLITMALAGRVDKTQRQPLQCIPLLKHIQYLSNVTERVWECQLLQSTPAANGKSGRILKLDNLEDLNLQLHEKDSGLSILTLPQATVTTKKIKVPKGSRAKIDRSKSSKGKPPSSTSTSADDNVFEDRVRRLVEGNKRILAIRVVDSAGVATTSSAAALADNIFGQGGNDLHNLASQYKACSYNKLNFVPITALNQGDPPLAAVGVYEVKLSIRVVTGETSEETVREAVTEQLNQDWDSTMLPEIDESLPNQTPFDHIMYCLPPGTGGWVAYAFLNSWLSVYNDEWCNKLSAQMHEIGHNIGLRHAGQVGAINSAATYGDQSCIMGYAYKQDEGPLMCFNAAKSWQLGWYANKQYTVEPLLDDWTGTIMGIADYGSSAPHYVILKIETGLPEAFYLNLNRKKGINSGTREGGDKVMLTRQTGAGESKLVAILDSGDRYFIRNFAGTEKPVRVTVMQIHLAVSPALAIVTVEYDRCSRDEHCGPGPNFACSDHFCNLATRKCEASQPTHCNCDSTCEATIEDASSCPADCGATSQLLTTLDAGNGQAGNMFDVKALKDIQITGFEIHTVNGGSQINAFVYTKTGSYVGYDTDGSDYAWTLIQSATVISQGLGNLTPLPLLEDPVVMSAGSTHAFYVTLDINAMKYTNGDAIGAVYASDSNLQIFQGVGKTFPFADSFSPRVWNGNLKYAPPACLDVTISCSVGENNECNGYEPNQNKCRQLVPFKYEFRNIGTVATTLTLVQLFHDSPNPQNLLADLQATLLGVGQSILHFDEVDVDFCAGSTTTVRATAGPCEDTSTYEIQGSETNWELITTMDDNNGQAGNQFVVEAIKDIRITGFDIHAFHGGTSVSVEVYTKTGTFVGSEAKRDEWTLLQSVDVESMGEGTRTPLPPLPEPVVLSAESRQAFYVTLDGTGIRYTNGKKVGDLFVLDENLKFFEGVGVSYPFGRTFSPRIFNGAIRYKVLGTDARIRA